ncbi:hypothetical protein PAMP_001874 [Pampus punctatissimus]
MHATCCVVTHLITHSCPFVQDIKIYQRHPGETSLRLAFSGSKKGFDEEDLEALRHLAAAEALPSTS